jgi:hypothetical protein
MRSKHPHTHTNTHTHTHMHVHTYSHRPLIDTDTDTNPLHHPKHTANMLAHPLALHSHIQAHTHTHLTRTRTLVLLLNSHRRRHIDIHPQTRHLHLRYTHHTRTAHKHHTHTAHKHRLPDPPSQCISRCSSPLGAPPSPAGTGLSSGARTPSGFSKVVHICNIRIREVLGLTSKSYRPSQLFGLKLSPFLLPVYSP